MKVRSERVCAGPGVAGGLLAGLLSWQLMLTGCAATQDGQVGRDGQDGQDGQDGIVARAEPASGGYFAARGRELARAFDVSLSFGPGLGARVALTRHLQAGLLMVDATDPAPHNLRPVNVTVGVRDGEVGAWSLRSLEYGVSPWYRADALVRRLDSEETAQRIDPSIARDARISAQVHLALIGAEFGFDALAFGRFLVGLVGFGEAGFFAQ